MSLKRINSVLNICFQRSSLWPKSEDSKNSSLNSLQSPTSYESFISVCENCISRVFFSVLLLALLERLASVCHQDWLQLLPPQRFQSKTVPLLTPPTNRLTPPLCAAHNVHTGVLDCCGGWCGSIPALTAYADTRFSAHLTVLSSSSHCLKSGQAASDKAVTILEAFNIYSTLSDIHFCLASNTQWVRFNFHP